MAFLQKLVSQLFGNTSSAKQQPVAERAREAGPVITVTDDELACFYPSKNITEKIAWAHINGVDILTTDEGPFVCDVFILITDNNGGVVIPHDREECKAVIDRIFKLPGFNFQEFTNAMSSAQNNKFVVWRKA